MRRILAQTIIASLVLLVAPVDGRGEDKPTKPLTLEQKKELQQQRKELVGEFRKLVRARKISEAMATQEKVLIVEKKLFGETPSLIIPRLKILARDYETLGQYAAAEKKLQEIVQIRVGLHGKDHWKTIEAQWIVKDLAQRRRLKPEQRKEIREVDSLSRHIPRLSAANRYREAFQLAQRVLQVRRRLLGDKHPAYAKSLNDLAELYRSQSAYAKALPLYRQSRDIFKATLGENNPSYAASLHNLANLYREQGKYANALPLYQQARDIHKAVFGEKHSTYATSLNYLAELYHVLGEHTKALPLFLQSRDIYKAVFGEKHFYYARSLNNLALLHRAKGEYAKALPLLLKAGEIAKAVLGEKNPDYASFLNNLAELYRLQGEYAKALPLYQQSRDILKATVGEKHPSYATSLNNLAELYRLQGEYTKALPLYQQSSDIHKAIVGKEHPRYAFSLNNQAALYRLRGDYAKALTLYQQSRSIFKATLGEGHPRYARLLNNLAELYQAQGQIGKAVTLCLQARDSCKAAVGEKHPDYANALGFLAGLYRAQGDSANALSLAQKARDIYKVALGEKHPIYALSLHNLAELYRARGDYAKALTLYRQSRDISKAAAGEKHSDYATVLHHLAKLYLDQGDYRNAEKWLLQSANVFLTSRRLVSLAGLDRAGYTSEHSRLDLLCAVLAHNKQPGQAWEWLERGLGSSTLDELRIRQKLTDDEQREIQKLQRRIQTNQELLQRLTSKPKLSKEQQALQKKWLLEKSNLHAKLGAAQDRIRKRLEKENVVLGGKSLSLKEIQSSLSPKIALLTWVDAQEHWAVVVRHQGKPIFVQIHGTGPQKSWTKQESALAKEVRQRLSSPAHPATEQIAALSKQRIDPVLAHLKGIEHLVILPSPMMDGIPVELLVQDKTVSYAPSGTMYAHLSQQKKPQSRGLLALGDPLFEPMPKQPTLPRYGLLLTAVVPNSNAAKAGLSPGDVLQGYHRTTLKTVEDLKKALSEKGVPNPVRVKYWRRGRMRETEISPGSLGVAVSRESAPMALFSRHKDRVELALRRGGEWKELPGTRVEVETLKRRFKQSTIYTDSQASEQTLMKLSEEKKLSGYRYLHFATHGKTNRINRMQSAVILSHDKLPDTRTAVEMLSEGKEVPDGRLTAKEVLSTWQLDADLVTISACESGLGRHERGESFMGFPQAFLLQGARSVVLSLWKVDDTATALLMDRFYENLLGQRQGIKPMSKIDALTEAKKWLRELPRDEVLKRAARLSKGVVRGKGNPDLLLLPEVPKAKDPKMKTDAPYAHPYYWSAFVLVGKAE